ncbi:MAG TPA: hypothetical protein VI522_05080, partial [Gammaproteobacteria bacterium]|nr:hypothetical protein [Gammaproteobacteria bacterium]
MIGVGRNKGKYVRAISGALIAALLIYFSYTKFKTPATEMAGMGAPTTLVTTALVVAEEVPLIVNVFGSLRA